MQRCSASQCDHKRHHEAPLCDVLHLFRQSSGSCDRYQALSARHCTRVFCATSSLYLLLDILQANAPVWLRFPRGNDLVCTAHKQYFGYCALDFHPNAEKVPTGAQRPWRTRNSAHAESPSKRAHSSEPQRLRASHGIHAVHSLLMP